MGEALGSRRSVRELESGRRYYGDLRPARNPGAMAGQRTESGIRQPARPHVDGNLSTIRAGFVSCDRRRAGRRSTTSSTKAGVTVASADVPGQPSRDDLRERIDGLIAGTADREAVASWAWQWVVNDVDVDDPVVWEALNCLAGADAPTIDREYLHGQLDFKAWREALDGDE